MCGMAGVGAGLSMLTSLTSFMGANEDYENRLYTWKQNQINALATGRDTQGALTLRQIQEGDAFVQKAHLENLKEAKAKGEANTAAAEAGVSGLSVDAIIREIGSQSAFNRDTERQNYLNAVTQQQAEKKASVNQIKSQINAVPAPTKPNPFGYLLSGIGGGLRAFAV